MSEREGWLQATFYPQNGGADQQNLWYGDSSLLSEVRLWWADAQDGKGKIMVHSDNNPNDLLLGACDNASRVVKYVVVMGQGYASNPLLDMRIHDINVEAEISRHVPSVPEPVEADGTITSVCDDMNNKFDADTEQFANQALAVEWTSSLWPTIGIVLDAISGAVLTTVDLTIDILGTISIISTELAVAGIDFDDEVTVQRVAQQVEQTAISTAQTGNILSWATLGVTVGSWLAINWGTYAIFLTTLLIWYTALIAHLNAVCVNLANGHTTVADALSTMSSVFATWLTKMLGFAIARSTLHGRVMYILEEIFGESNAVAMKAAKWTMIVSGFICFAGLVYLWGQISITQPMDAIFTAPDWTW